MKKITLILTAVLLTGLTGCVNSDYYEAPDLSGECTSLPVTKTVPQIISMGTTTAQQYTADDVIEAYVVSSDEGGNFYKSISLVSTDNTVGFSMPVDAYNLYTKYEPGRKVYIRMKDRYFANDTQIASFEIGSLYSNAVGRISGVEYENAIVRGCDKVDENTLAIPMTISQAKSNANINKLIEIDAVQFSDEFVGKTYYDSLNVAGGATNNIIRDMNGNDLIIRVSSFANFAGNIVPSKSGKIRGVMTKYNSDFQFMVRTINDIKLNDDRFTVDLSPPIGGTNLIYGASLNEPFTSYTQTNQQVFPAYINDAAVGSRYWQVRTFGGNKYIQMSSFGGTPEVNRTLFFVPVDLTAASTFSFKTKAGFANGSCLKVYYTQNYVPGTDVNTATLVDITSNFSISPGLSTGYPTNFTNSNNWSIPAALTGNGFFVFEYSGNGNGGVTTTMQIDDISIN